MLSPSIPDGGLAAEFDWRHIGVPLNDVKTRSPHRGRGIWWSSVYDTAAEYDGPLTRGHM